MRELCSGPAGTDTDDIAQRMALFADAIFTAPKIAVVIFGDESQWRKIYKYKAKGWPIFRVGRELVARRSSLEEYIRQQEGRTQA